eukprot:11150478-Alexandrium_andersonii.AAC.1
MLGALRPHRVLVSGGHTMNAYGGKYSQMIVSRIRNNVYGWNVPAVPPRALSSSAGRAADAA